MDKLKDANRDRINVRKLINLTKKEKYFLKNATYCNYFPLQKKVYNYYGEAENAQDYLQEKLVGENDDKFIKILIKIINKVGKCYPTKKHIWLSVRVKNPYIEECVRWHWDGPYYGHSDNELHSKFIATLCGPQTFGINATQLDKQFYKTLRMQKFAGTITKKRIWTKISRSI